MVCSKSNRGRYTSPALAAASYPFVDLPVGDTLRCKLFPADKFHKICYLFDSLHSYDLLNQYAMKSLTIAPDNPKAYCWLIRSLKAQGMNELATNELAAAKEHLTTEEYEEILAFGANW